MNEKKSIWGKIFKVIGIILLIILFLILKMFFWSLEFPIRPGQEE